MLEDIMTMHIRTYTQIKDTIEKISVVRTKILILIFYTFFTSEKKGKPLKWPKNLVIKCL